jgi:hypothetical protein
LARGILLRRSMVLFLAPISLYHYKFLTQTTGDRQLLI